MKVKSILSTVLIAVIVGFLSVLIYHNLYNTNQNVDSTNLNTIGVGQLVNNTTIQENVDFTFAAEKAVHAVVHIKTTYQSEQDDSRYQFFFGRSPAMPYIGSGSGVIISTDGYIVTNNHVIEQSNNIEVVLNDKRSFRAIVIGIDPATDLALLKIDTEKLVSIPFGNSDILKVGEWVLAVGNPFNLTSTVTAGIVSAKARNINLARRTTYSIESFIQTDAAVNPGNSGGALVNINGELVGINTAIATKTGSYSGYSFAIPVSIVQKIVADLKEYGIVQRALIGINISDIDADAAKELGLDKIEGVYVSGTLEGGAAEKSGIQKGDVILRINNTLVNKTSELQEQVSMFRPGDKVMVTLKRENIIKKIEVTLQNLRGNTKTVGADIQSVLGAQFEKLSQKEMERFGIRGGMKVTQLNQGKLKKAGVRKGYIIISINRQAVSNIEDVENAIKNANGGVYLKGIYSNGIVEYYAFGMEK
ncbi:MAG: deoxyribonuclease HsdR [Bacteroidetes bacterium]|nr:MAG: deoxyribonuclease HsdR [Bacteroidota bacterium]